MRGAVVTLWAAAALLVCLLPAWSQAAFSLEGDWWQQPAQQTRHTTLVATFDSADDNNADFALGMPLDNSYGVDSDVAGMHGRGAKTTVRGGYVFYRGGSNFQGLHGTMRIAVRGDIWADADMTWLFEARAEDRTTSAVSRIGVQRAPGKLSLVFTVRSHMFFPWAQLARLDLDVGDVSTDEWHIVVASWDRASSTGWIALDGKGISGPMQFSNVVAPAVVVCAGTSDNPFEPGGMNAANALTVDDFLLYDQALPSLEAAPANELATEDAELLPVAEAAARRNLYKLMDLQQVGGWQFGYSWPTLLPMGSAFRQNPTPDDYILNLDKGNSTMAAVQDFTYGYEVLGDHGFIDAMSRTAEALMAGQQPEGWWAYGYFMKPGGMEGIGTIWAKFQDHVQSYPMYFLAYMYRLTGEQRYLDAAMKAGQFYITVQNPNGSYPHHWDPATKIGRTNNDLPYGGEINDGASNDAMDVMAFMYHMTGEPKYVQALKRVGDWFVEAQGEDIPLWADQYDQDNNPVWARNFEPPAYGYDATVYALQALREMYRFSGDQRYLDAMRKALAWVEANLPDGMMSYYIELGTGRPIAATDNKIYYLDQPESMAYLRTVPIGPWQLQMHPMARTTRSIIDNVAKPSLQPPTPDGSLQTLPTWRERAQAVLATQDESGLWISHETNLGTIGAFARGPQWEVRTVLRYIEEARMALGELAAERRGQADPRATAYPYSDWYDVDWTQNCQ